jgi:hypothetical protein
LARVGAELLQVNVSDADLHDNGEVRLTMLGPDHKTSQFFEVRQQGNVGNIHLLVDGSTFAGPFSP